MHKKSFAAEISDAKFLLKLFTELWIIQKKSWFSLEKEQFSSFQTKNGMDQGVRWLKLVTYDCCKWCDMPHRLDLPKTKNPFSSGLKSHKVMISTQKWVFFKYSDQKRHGSRHTMASIGHLRLLQMMWYVSSIRFAEKKKSISKWFEKSKSHDFDSKMDIFQVFRPKMASIMYKYRQKVWYMCCKASECR